MTQTDMKFKKFNNITRPGSHPSCKSHIACVHSCRRYIDVHTVDISFQANRGSTLIFLKPQNVVKGIKLQWKQYGIQMIMK